jgi:hypothetical protein
VLSVLLDGKAFSPKFAEATERRRKLWQDDF